MTQSVKAVQTRLQGARISVRAFHPQITLVTISLGTEHDPLNYSNATLLTTQQIARRRQALWRSEIARKSGEGKTLVR
jgi:hypothetical protein